MGDKIDFLVWIEGLNDLLDELAMIFNGFTERRVGDIDGVIPVLV